MPLIKSPSKAAKSSNIAELMKSGYKQKQAVAIGYSEQRKAGGHAPAPKGSHCKACGQPIRSK